MRVILPPSETKRDGGDGAALDLDGLAFPELRDRRSAVLDALIELAADEEASVRALKLGRTQLGEIDRNRQLRSAATMPAIDRYTGVLFDGLAAESWSAADRAFAHENVVIQSALFGPIAALDEIPAYRLSHDSRLPGLRLRAHWAAESGAALSRPSGLLVDLRSEGYAALGPLGADANAVYVRVVTEDGDGTRRALAHFNKQAKGRLVAALVASRARLDDPSALVDWGDAHGHRFSRTQRIGPGGVAEIELVV
ncbi:peroxide stress protein YaaA [Agromyces rhizosphaerae]|uniref:Peroxide stress protein YaaA n=1 Tax=Agromyces rhizosphaerae TaxID=88374 RepID=A0A9W6CNS1_9MICO|nr:peroxide stress protein YaaA [Agromyces rhizosphaerae]GLI25976.1 peroxide stress protein YaaA [Agromyces rhizosphaerae]